VADDAVRAVASGEPICVDKLLTAVSATKRRLRTVGSDLERGGLRAALRRDAEALKPFLE
jgi:hypothetical protein